MKVSFCTTCKGRLWQLSQTLPHNLSMLDDHSEIVLLDYHSPDGLREYIFENYAEVLGNKLKYYRMIDDYSYTSSYAKNVAHRLADGDVLFNLDGDNYITDGLLDDLRSLTDTMILLPVLAGTDSGIGGRIGYHRSLFRRIGGYCERIVGMQGDDGEFRYRARQYITRTKHHANIILPIQNTREQKDMYTADNPDNKLKYPPRKIFWGAADVVSWDDRFIRTF